MSESKVKYNFKLTSKYVTNISNIKDGIPSYKYTYVDFKKLEYKNKIIKKKITMIRKFLLLLIL